MTKCSTRNSHNYCGLPEKYQPIACTWQHPLSYHIFSQGNLASGICMLIYLKKKTKQNKNKIADNQKRMYFYMCHISLVQENKKNIHSRNSVKTKMSLFWFQYFNLFYYLINEHVLNISDY